jgi:hypothetical protein
MTEKKEKKISRREALKRMAKAGTMIGGVALFSSLSGCYIDYTDAYSDGYSDYGDSYSNSYSDYSDYYNNSYGDAK